MDERNVVLTGVPRSGTTLSCHLLNKLPDTVALAEPIRPVEYVDLPDLEAVCEGFEGFYRRMRRMALRKGVVISKNVGGAVPDNPISQTKDDQGHRQRLWRRGRIPVEKDLSRDFTLVIKHPIMFTNLLPYLTRRFPCYAIVRNPLSLMASGVSTRGSTRRAKRVEEARGGARKATATDAHRRAQKIRLDQGLMARLSAIEDPIERRLVQLSWFFERYEKELPLEHVIRYEDLIASGGKALSVITPAARELEEQLSSMNLNKNYDRDEMLRSGERLLKSEGAYWRFYSREEVEDLLARLD